MTDALVGHHAPAAEARAAQHRAVATSVVTLRRASFSQLIIRAGRTTADFEGHRQLIPDGFRAARVPPSRE